mgnify:FL=1
MKNNIIIEGSDGVGKTSTINELKKEHIICQDRSKDIISKYMMFDVDMEYRTKKYYEFLKNNDCIVIFLINNDKKELMRRIYSRKKISDFDLQAYEYNILYKDTYLYMKENNMLNNKLFMIDCTGLSLNEQINKVKKIIIDIYNYNK